MKQTKLATEPSVCRKCGQDILWVVWPKSGKKMPVDAVPDMRPGVGDVVLTLVGGPNGELRAEKHNPNAHEMSRNRYTSHFSTCPQAESR